MIRNNVKRMITAIISVSMILCSPVGTVADTAHKATVGNPYKSSTKTVSYDVYDGSSYVQQAKPVTVWDCVWFGSYWQDSTDKSGDKQPIKWRVLSVKGNDALIMADRGLDSQKYYTSDKRITWKDCYIRNWLNNDFYNDAFSDTDKSAIISANLVNDNNPKYETNGGDDTTDKVFLLSIADSLNPSYGFDGTNYDYYYNSYDPGKCVVPTAYAEARGAWPTIMGKYEGNGWWWLRSPGIDTYYAARVNYNGSTDVKGVIVRDTNACVRPALHLDLSSSGWKSAGIVCSDGTVDETAATGYGKTPDSDTPDSDISDSGSDSSDVDSLLSKVSSKSFTVGSDTYTVSWKSYIRYNGRKHSGIGTDASLKPVAAKSSKSKVYDVLVTVKMNGKVIDPSNYKIKTKNNKNASVSIDGITALPSASKKPSFSVKFKGREFKELNNSVKKVSFEFGIIPAELKQNSVTFDKVKKENDGSVRIKKMIYKPESGAGNAQNLSVNMKYSKNAGKTDYITESNKDGSITVTGKNNYYGSVVYKKDNLYL